MTKPKTIADLTDAAQKLRADLDRLKPQHRAAEATARLRPIAEAIAQGAAAEIVKAREAVDLQTRMLRTARHVIADLSVYNDAAQVIVREMRRARLVDKLEAIEPHLRLQTLRNDLEAGRLDRIEAVEALDEHGELIPRADLDQLLIERGKRIAPVFAERLAEAERNLSNAVSAAHELGVMATRAVAGLGIEADSIVDRGSFLGSPRRAASYAEHLEAERAAAETPAA